MGWALHLVRGADTRGQLWRRAWFASGVIVLVATISHVHTTRILPDSADDVLSLAYEQRVLTHQIVGNALRLDASVGGEEYDDVAPVMKELIANAKRWEGVHEQLAAVSAMGVDDPIARLVNPHTQIDRGLDELILVGRSAERRVPYLDLDTVDRIARARALIVSNERRYSDALTQMTEMRLTIEQARRDRFRSASSSGLLVLIAMVVGSVPIVVFPVLAVLAISREGRETEQTGSIPFSGTNKPIAGTLSDVRKAA